MTSVSGTDRTTSTCNPCDATCKSCIDSGLTSNKELIYLN